jgi:hypothetical protein
MATISGGHGGPPLRQHPPVRLRRTPLVDELYRFVLVLHFLIFKLAVFDPY